MAKETIEKNIDKDIDVNINYLKDLLGVGETFDIIFREYKVGRRRAASFSINGMTNDLLLSGVFQDIMLYNRKSFQSMYCRGSSIHMSRIRR